jgi:prepilin signal peptidase PulO-like enzyme (type II secretory pathway)
VGTLAIEMIGYRIIVGVVVGLVCGFVSSWLERYILNKRNLEVYTSKIESAIILVMEMIVGGVILVRFQLVTEIIYAFLILIICVTISVIDFHYRIIPNELLLGMLIIKILVGVLGLAGIAIFPKWNILLSLVGLVTGFIVFAIPGAFGKAVGAGDVKLAASVGFCLGVNGLLSSIVLMGLGVLAFSLIQKNKTLRNMMYDMIPLGPFMSVAMIIVMLAQ